MRGVLGAIVIVLGACTVPENDDAPAIGETREAIVDGIASPASQDAAVLISDTGEPVCTGALIAPNLVLTARHCVTDYNDNSECGGPLGHDRPANVLTVSIGADATSRGFVARGTRLFTPTSTQLCGADIALIMLDDDVKNVTPMTVRFADPIANELGTAIGYGDSTRAQRAGVKILALGPAKTTYTTAAAQALTMNLGADEAASSESTCYGDSGGPLLDANGHLMAIASRGLDDYCRDRPTLWSTFAGHADLINDAAIAAGHPLTGASTATTPNSTTPTVASSTTELADAGATTKTGSAAAAPDPGASCSATPGATGGSSFAAIALGLAVAASAKRSSLSRPRRPAGGSRARPCSR